MALPALSTPRLRLRSPQIGDELFLSSLDADEKVLSAETQIGLAVFQRYFGRWVILLRDDVATPVGWVELAKYHGLRIDDTLNDYLALAYQMSPAYWGQGFMTEAARAVLDYAFKLRLSKVLAYARPENMRSIKLIERLGFQRVGNTLDETRAVCDLYQLTREEWRGEASGART